MGRPAGVILGALFVLLLLANAVVFAVHRWRPGVSDAGGLTPMERWLALPLSQRAAYVERYRGLTREPGGATALRRAREFGGLPTERQGRLREVYAVFRELWEAQPPGRRGEWLRASGRTRGFLAFQALRHEHPQRLSDLRAAWGRP
jgi:hypothetical protein